MSSSLHKHLKHINNSFSPKSELTNFVESLNISDKANKHHYYPITCCHIETVSLSNLHH